MGGGGGGEGGGGGGGRHIYSPAVYSFDHFIACEYKMSHLTKLLPFNLIFVWILTRPLGLPYRVSSVKKVRPIYIFTRVYSLCIAAHLDITIKKEVEKP